MGTKNMVKSKTQLAEIIVIFLLTLLFGVGMGNIFVGHLNLLDEGQFLSWPSQMLAGKLMYADLFVMYGPLYVYPLYLVTKLFGPSFFAIRTIFWIESLFGILTVYFICTKFGFKNLTRVLIILFMTLLPGMQIRQAVSLFTVYIFWIAKDARGAAWWLLLGALCVITFLVSPEIGIYLGIAMLADVIMNPTSWIQANRLKHFLLGMITVGALFTAWSYLEGWFSYYVTDTIFVLSGFSGVNAALGKNFPNLLGLIPQPLTFLSLLKLLFSPEALMYWGILFLIIGFIYFAQQVILRKFTKQDRQILPIYFLALFSYLAVVGRASVNNMYFVLPFALIVGGYLVELINSGFKPWNKNLNQKVIPAIVIIVILMIPIRLVTINRLNILNNLKMIGNYSSYVPISEVDPLRIPPAQKKYLDEVRTIAKRHTSIEEPIFILHDEPGLYVIANRVNASKYDLPYFANTFPLRMQVLREIETAKPKIIIWNPAAWAVDEIPNDIRLPELVRYINANYNKTNVGGVNVYKLK